MIQAEYEINLTNGIIEQFKAITGADVTDQEKEDGYINIIVDVYPNERCPDIEVSEWFYGERSILRSVEVDEQIIDFIKLNTEGFEEHIDSLI